MKRTQVWLCTPIICNHVIFCAFEAPLRSDSRELEGNRDEAIENSGPLAEEGLMSEEDAASWYLGKAKEEFRRRKLSRNAGQLKVEAEDPIEVK
jgi:hypothetical protein